MGYEPFYKVGSYTFTDSICGIGERAEYTWFVLKYLLGYSNVKTYDGSWLE
jgi:3-mercaptopyruvate sulfurtransferase SseA